MCLELPIVYSLKHHIKGADDFLFFSVDEPMRVFGKMIAVSVDMQHSNQLIEQLLLIPEEAFGVSGTCVLLRGDELYRQSVVSPDGIQDFIVELARLCMQKKLVLSKE